MPTAQLVTMPKLSDTMKTGTLVKWLKAENDPVKFGDILAEIETDKATMEFESFSDGVLLKIYAQPGSTIPIGAPLCAIGNKGDTLPDVPTTTAPATPPTPSAPPPAPPSDQGRAVSPKPPPSSPTPPTSPTPPSTPANQPATTGTSTRLKISPLARKLAQEKNIDPSRIQGTGPAGRITRADILAYEKNPTSTSTSPRATGTPQESYSLLATRYSLLPSAPIQADGITPLNNIRAITGKRLLESKTQIPHFYLSIDVNCDALLTLREQLNAVFAEQKQPIKLSVNDLILKAATDAMRKVSAVNSSWETEGIRAYGSVHIAFAVALPDGLITPVIRDAHAKTLFQISEEAKTLGTLAKNKKLKPDQYTGGTFTVSNLGMMGITQFNAIINPPNAAILAIGTTTQKPIVKDNQILIASMMTLTLSADHRVIDGATAAQYMATLKSLLESPAQLLL